GVHVRVGMKVEHLTRLPKVPGATCIYLSQMAQENHIEWAVNTTSKLQPRSGCYSRLVLPRCKLNVVQLCDLVGQLATEGVTVSDQGGIELTCNFNGQEKQQLQDTVRRTLNCSMVWRQDDERLTGW
ncbi:unnamed protein product, partial [Meganyctiphanes norvegica]